MDRLDSNRLVTFPAFKQMIFVVRLQDIKTILEHLKNAIVDHQDIFFLVFPSQIVRILPPFGPSPDWP